MSTYQESIDEIEELAEFISETYWSGHRLEPEEVIDKNGIFLVNDDFEDAFDGLLHFENGNFTIFCNTAKNGEGRKRFTLAHELGHFYIPRHRHALINGGLEHPSHSEYTSNHQMEREADCFASNLLMPKKQYMKAAKKLPKGLEGVRMLSTKFGTSLTSTAIRYLDLYLSEGLLIKWSSNGEFSWARLPSKLRFSYKTLHINNRAQLVRDSATDEFLSGRGDQHIIYQKATVKSVWFKNLSQQYDYSEIWMENVISLGQYGYLTLVFPDNVL